MKTATTEKTLCDHCGDECRRNTLSLGDKKFCCQGCKTVYEILSESGLEQYYKLEDRPGVKKENDQRLTDFAFLDLPEIKDRMLTFSDGQKESVTLNLPAIHCSSCIWLLENLHRLHEGVLRSEVNFVQKEATIQYDNKLLTLRRLAELLDSLGYKPLVELKQGDQKKVKQQKDLHFIYKLGVAGFAFGNIMLLSFPEYFEEGMYEDETFGAFFGYVNLILALPVFFYASSDYFVSAWKGLKHKILNIDVPISLGIFVLFFRSAYEVISHTGAGYFDSMTGLVFFLLVGRWFQNRTYRALSFERDYHSYFPLGVLKKKGESTERVLLKDISEGDHIYVRNGELIPADAQLVEGSAQIDYSFVTGESEPVDIVKGSKLYAGGRQIGGQIEIQLLKDFSQSYLMQLWKHEQKTSSEKDDLGGMINLVSQYFTAAILTISILAGIYWAYNDPSKIVHTITSVLIIACPCALALSIPFTYGNGLKLMEKGGMYLRDARFIERISQIKTIVFDKTGTITVADSKKVGFVGEVLNEEEKQQVASLSYLSNHPLSRAIYEHLNPDELVNVENFSEEQGQGIKGELVERSIILGNHQYTESEKVDKTAVHLKINGQYKGYFAFENEYRPKLQEQVSKLYEKFELKIISGDTDAERNNLTGIFGRETEMKFRMDPFDKLTFIRELQESGSKTLMIGDGLNDAGAIREAYVGMSISDDIYGFLPSCDAILESNSFNKLSSLLQFCQSSVSIVKISFAISFLYNIVGLSFAVQGMLSPVLAAILMPLSSISVVAFTIVSTNFVAKKLNFL